MSHQLQPNRLKRLPKLSLSQKGLLLLAAPLAVQLGLVCTLSNYYNQAEADARQSERSRQIAETTNDTIKQTYALIRDTFASIEHATTGDALPPMDTAQLMQSLSELQTLVKDNPSDVAVLEESRKATSDLQEVYARVSAAFASGEFAQNHDLRKSTYKHMRTYAHRLEPLVAIEKSHKEFAAGSAQRQAAVRHAANTVVLLGTMIDVLLLLTLVWFFNRNIIHRLAILMDNNIRLTAEKPLHPALSGSDEIAQLDRGFHAMAQALTESMDKQRRAERLRKEVMQMVSHDLRSPLTTILGIVQMFQRNIPNEADRDRLLLVADSNAGRMLRLINDLLDIEKMEAGGLPLFKESVTTRQVFEESLQTISGIATAKQVKINSSHGDFTFMADKDRLVQVVSNLLSNALKFSPSNTTITLSAHLDRAFLVISVEDQGRGIPSEMLETIFQRFKQIQRSDSHESHGHGLGLAICQALVELHGGTIGVTSEVGVGSTFFLRIPFDQPSSASWQVIDKGKTVPADR